MKATTIILIAIITLSSCLKEERVKCKIMSHSTSSGAYGKIYYHTIIRTIDGELKDVDDMYSYTLPIGSETTVDVLR